MLIFRFTESPTNEIYPLSLHDALPICMAGKVTSIRVLKQTVVVGFPDGTEAEVPLDQLTWEGRPHIQAQLERSEEHTSELQSHSDLVCRLLLEKKKDTYLNQTDPASTQ